MAGIIVSGGVYSGSGDVTADWLYMHYHASGTQKVWLPDGTLTLVSETGNNALKTAWCGSSDNWQHQNGTVKITLGGGTIVDVNGAAAEVTGRDGQLYNLIINQNSNPRATDPVLLSTVDSSGFYTVVENSLTIISGTARIGDTDVTNYTKLGHVYIGASGTFSAGNVAAVNNGGYNNWDSSGSIYAKTVIFNGANSVFVGNGGTITFTGPYAGNGSDHYVWENPTLGTYYHNSGTIQFGGGTVYGPGETAQYSSYMNFKNLDRPADGTGQASNGDGGWFYNVSGGFRDQDTPSRHLGIQLAAQNSLKVSNNFSLMSGASIDTSTYNITISGTVFLDEDAYWGNYATQGGTKTIGALYMANGGNYFKAPTGSLTINNQTSDSYKFRIENNGTFVHNDGTIVLDASTVGGMYKNTGSNGKFLYNLIVKNDNTSARAVQNVYDVTVANNLIVSGAGSDADDWDVGFYNAGDGNVIASGTTTVVSGAKLGRSSQNNTFGKLILGKKGWLDAGTGTTTLQGATAGSDRTKILQTKEDSLFTHNSGTVDFSCATGGLSTAYIWLDGKATADPFWNTTFNGNTGIHAYTWYKFYAGSSGVITFEGDTAKAHNGSAVFELANSSTFQLGRTGASMLFGPMNWFYGNGSSTNLIKSVDTTYPAYISGTSNNKLLGTSGDSYTPVKTTLEDIKLDDLEGELKGNLHLSGQCEVVKALTVNTAGVLTVASGQTAKFNEALNITGNIVTSGSLINFADGYLNYDGAGWLGGETTDIMFTGVGTSNDFAGQSYKHIVFNGTATGSLNWTTSFPDTPIIVAGGTFKPDHNVTAGNISIAYGGTWDNDVDTLTLSSGKNFNNRGGFFTSSSALDLDGTDYVALGDGMATQTAVTLEAWVKPSEAPHENTMLGTDGSKGGILSSNTPNKFRIKHESVNSSYTDVDYNWVVDQWQHMCFTWDGTTGKAYANGILLKEWALSGTPYNLTKAAIGSLNTGSASWPWEGNIARGSFWKTALTAAEIREMMFYDWATVTTSSIDQTKCVGWYQFDEGEGTSISDMSGSGNTGTLNDASAWVTAGTWAAGGSLGSSTDVLNGNLYIGTHATNPTMFASSYFDLANRKLIEGSKLVSKSHMGELDYYIATSGTNDYLNYQHLVGAPIGVHNDVYIMANGALRSYFEFDADANNEQCNTLVNSGVVRVATNSDFYTQDFDNSQGEWLRSTAYDGVIHDDGSTPHEYEPIDIMDDLDSFFDREDLID